MKTIHVNNSNTRRFIGMILTAILGGVIAVMLYASLSPRQIAISAEQPSYARFARLPANNDTNPMDFTYAADRSVHAVVHVKTTAMQAANGYSNPFYNFFFGDGQIEQKPQPVSGIGSGVIISADGYIVTNNHVVDDADKVEVTLNNKHSYIAEVVGRDPNTDLAVIKIKETNLPYITYGNSDELKVGEWVLAVGNPFNLTSTVTAGIVSAKARNLNILSGRDNAERNNTAIESFIQTDAAVNPGNSGGALVNTRGELIGINTAIASPTGSYIGNSFAIPVTIVKKVVADIIEYGKVQRALLGVSIQDIDDKLAKENKLEKWEGVYIENVSPGSAAEAAGIKAGDIILSINNVNVNSSSELQEQVSRYRPNDKIMVVVNHENKKKQIEVTLRNTSGTKTLASKDDVISILGAQLGNVPDGEKTKLGIKSGVKVNNIGSGKLRAQGVQNGFIITNINNHPVNTVDEVKNELSNFKGGVLIEGIYPNGVIAYYAFGI